MKQMQTLNPYQEALAKVRSHTDASLLAIWEALNTRAAWIDNRYNEYITLEEWANLVYIELSKRHLIKEEK